jgi:ribose transport system ATP-binding protein
LTLTETRRLLELVKDLKAENVSIIYISHRMHEVEEIADRAVVLRDGKNAGEISGSEITHERMVRMMVGRDLKEFFKDASVQRRVDGDGGFEVRRLRTLRYPNHRIAFNVAKGEVLGFAGLVGAGRSEVARAIFGVEETLEAEVALNGQTLRIQDAQDAITHGIYLVPEDRRLSGLIVDFNVRENITLPALSRYSSAGLVSKSRESKRAKEMCERLKVKAPSTETNASNLSGGNQQKVVLAKWLSLDPKLLIFDEPTRGIDVCAKSEIYQLMRDLAASGVAIMMISSVMEEILRESDRIAVMHEGAITGVLDRSEASEEAVMRLAVGH